MPLDIKQIEHIAFLARLELSEKEKKKFSLQFSSILNYFEKLQKAKIENIEITSQSINLNNIYRMDEIKNCEDDVKDIILHNAPGIKENYFKVGKIL